MSASFTGFQDKLNAGVQKTIAWISDTFGIKQQRTNKWVNELRTDASSNSSMMIGKTLYSASLFIFAVVLLPIYALMLLYYEPLFVEFIRRLFNKTYHSAVAEIMLQIRTTVQSYLRGLLIEGAIVATLNSLALLVLGIQYAILIGIIGAILNVIPFIGGFAAVLLPMLVALVTKGSSYALLVLASLVLVQFIDNHYLIPKIVASKVKINALISVLVVLAGDALWGIPGMFLSIPLTAIIKIIFDHIEPLKPWGYLLGDDIPSNTIISVFFKNQRLSKSVTNKVK
jgi:predicted PurR-regulated permease PerM